MKQILRKGVSVILIFVLVIGMAVPSFAVVGGSVEVGGQTIAITPLTDTSCMLSDGSSTAILSIEETEVGANVVLTQNGENTTFVIDQANSTIYSPYTNKIVKVNNDDDREDAKTTITPHGTGKILKTYTYKFSYKQIAEITGKTTDIYGVASALVTLFLAASGLGAIPTLLTLILGGLRDLQITMILENVKKNASGGIKLTINKVEITKHQGGRIVKGVGYKLGGISTYK